MGSTPEFKQCPDCKRTMLSKDFYVNKRAPDGLHSKCKDCSVAIAKANRERRKQTKLGGSDG